MSMDPNLPPSFPKRLDHLMQCQTPQLDLHRSRDAVAVANKLSSSQLVANPTLATYLRPLDTKGLCAKVVAHPGSALVRAGGCPQPAGHDIDQSMRPHLRPPEMLDFQPYSASNSNSSCNPRLHPSSHPVDPKSNPTAPEPCHSMHKQISIKGRSIEETPAVCKTAHVASQCCNLQAVSTVVK